MEIINNKLVVSYCTTLHTFTRGEIKNERGTRKSNNISNRGERREW